MAQTVPPGRVAGLQSGQCFEELRTATRCGLALD